MGFIKKALVVFSFLFVSFAALAVPAHAATLLVSPQSGTFAVGSTFDVAVFLDTAGESVNVVDVAMMFPPDKLQLVSPTTGQSIIAVWTAQPVFNNQEGLIRLVGGIPGGINVSRGLVTSLTFRAKQVSDPVLIRFSDESRVLAHDGKGTDVLSSVGNGIYKLILPPPAGPVVISETHPDQSVWYAKKNIILRWASINPVEQYSYALNKNPIDAPDNIAEGSHTSVVYNNFADGIYYFHIAALRDGVWGGVTHFAVNIDTAPPAEFPIALSPSERTSSKNQLIAFQTTDILSGADHYEMKVINLTPGAAHVADSNEPFFIEAQSPHALSLDIGSYDIIIKAYDKAGNFREVTKRLKVVSPLFTIVTNQGVQFDSIGVIPWLWVWVIAGVVIVALGFAAWFVYHWHRRIILRGSKKELPEKLASQLEELKKYKQKYGMLLLLFAVLGSLFFGNRTYAQIQQAKLSPPFVSSISRDISNEEIFYIGGKTDSSGINVSVYLQNLQTGETFNDDVISDSKGNWFYRHPTFLTPGNYVLWTQSKFGEQMSPPSPQFQMTVRQTAIQFGASRLSYETLYLIIVIALLIIVFGLIGYILYHFFHSRRKHAILMKEISEAEESIRRGFAVLRRDIEAELAVMRRAKLSKILSDEEKQKEEQLMKDFDDVQKYIGKEVWDIEKEAI